MFDEDWRTWGAKGWDALERGVVELGGEGTSESGLLVRPHARHVVSDLPGCKRMLESSWAAERGVGLCYDPASMCAPGMAARAEDHLRRMYEGIEQMRVEGLGMVVVAGVDGMGAVCGVDRCGELGMKVLELAAAWVPELAAVVVHDERVGEQVEMLERAGV